MHVLADAVVVELLDANGRQVPPGETGEIVVTDLYSHEAPFLRYATGDLAAWSLRPCPCGRVLPLLERIEGRANDCVVARDGRLINALALVYPVREVEGIEEFRICQKAIDRFAVQVVRNARFETGCEERIRHAWESLLRSHVQVTFEYLPHLAPEPSGKFRHVVSDLSAGRSLRQAKNNASTDPVGTEARSN
jgi:phenylacetate-CoA ligase